MKNNELSLINFLEEAHDKQIIRTKLLLDNLKLFAKEEYKPRKKCTFD